MRRSFLKNKSNSYSEQSKQLARFQEFTVLSRLLNMKGINYR